MLLNQRIKFTPFYIWKLGAPLNYNNLENIVNYLQSLKAGEAKPWTENHLKNSCALYSSIWIYTFLSEGDSPK